MIITPKMLRDRNACPAYYNRFKRLFPNGVRVTQAGAKAVASKFDWHWASMYLIPGDNYRNHNAFNELTRDALDAYRAAYVTTPPPSARRSRQIELEHDRALAVAFARLVQNPKLRDEMSEAYNRRVQQRLTQSSIW